MIAYDDQAQGSKDPDLVQWLSDEIKSGSLVLISEEMFLVSQEIRDWEGKLNSLGDYLSNIPVSILVSIRNPIDGLPSLYQEIFDTLPLLYQLSFKRFCGSHFAKCYDYDYLAGC